MQSRRYVSEEVWDLDLWGGEGGVKRCEYCDELYVRKVEVPRETVSNGIQFPRQVLGIAAGFSFHHQPCVISSYFIMYWCILWVMVWFSKPANCARDVTSIEDTREKGLSGHVFRLHFHADFGCYVFFGVEGEGLLFFCCELVTPAYSCLGAEATNTAFRWVRESSDGHFSEYYSVDWDAILCWE